MAPKLEAIRSGVFFLVDVHHAGQEAVVTAAYGVLKEARAAVKKAEARRAKQDGQVAAALFADKPDPDVVCQQVDTIIAERDHPAEAKAAAEEAKAQHGTAVEKLAELRAELPKRAAKEALLASRKEIYQADTELDRITSVFKLGFVLLCEVALREFFAELNISLATFMRQILTLPGKRVVEGYQEFIHLAPPPNKETLAALERACARVNALKIPEMVSCCASASDYLVPVNTGDRAQGYDRTSCRSTSYGRL